MSCIDIFPTVVFKKKLNFSSNKLEDYRNNIMSFPMVSDGFNLYTTNTDKLLENNIFDDLSSLILSYSKEYLNEMGHQYEDIQISSSWGVSIDKGGYGGIHVHSNSYISGVFYLSGGSPITLLKPSPDIWKFNAPVLEKNYRSVNSFNISPEANLLIIFPSWLPHHINKTVQGGRTSIAFNIIPKGEFGRHTQKVYL